MTQGVTPNDISRCMSDGGSRRFLQEMRFNPIFELWTWLGLDKAYMNLMAVAPKPLEWVMWQVRIMCGAPCTHYICTNI
jgi:hypothetical protein